MSYYVLKLNKTLQRSSDMTTITHEDLDFVLAHLAEAKKAETAQFKAYGNSLIETREVDAKMVEHCAHIDAAFGKQTWFWREDGYVQSRTEKGILIVVTEERARLVS
jgi:hypothetical protein